MTLNFPALDVELVAVLHGIVVAQKYEPNAESDHWLNLILPKIIARLDLIAEVAAAQGETFSVRPEGVDLHASISGNHRRIVTHLQQHFSINPPFTIVRIAEILVDPTKEGYNLFNNVQILKYFNSLLKLVNVSSSVNDFPATTFSGEINANANGTRHHDHDYLDKQVVEPVITSQALGNIPLVKIPWLSEVKTIKKGETTLDSEYTTMEEVSSASSLAEQIDNHINGITETDQKQESIPVRRRREQENDNSSDEIAETTEENKTIVKKPKTNGTKNDPLNTAVINEDTNGTTTGTSAKNGVVDIGEAVNGGEDTIGDVKVNKDSQIHENSQNIVIDEMEVLSGSEVLRIMPEPEPTPQTSILEETDGLQINIRDSMITSE